jgi:hypothetical protein
MLSPATAPIVIWLDTHKLMFESYTELGTIHDYLVCAGINYVRPSNIHKPYPLCNYPSLILKATH